MRPTRARRKTHASLLEMRTNALALPIFREVVFIDWHGVLAKHPFWWSIVTRPADPLYAEWSRAVKELFGDTPTVHAWMRGQMTSEEVVQQTRRLGSELPPTAVLAQRLRDDCRRMPIDQDLRDMLARLREGRFVVLATDNMDCFRAEALRRRDLSMIFDSVLCSSDLGVLKSESPAEFFGAWLDQHERSFADATLIDDSGENCAAFRRAGGRAILYSSPMTLQEASGRRHRPSGVRGS